MYTVIRVDAFHDPTLPLENRITVKEVVSSLGAAESDVARLNALNESTGSRYFWQMTRLIVEDE